MKISVEEIKRIIDRRSEIDFCPFDDITFTKDGEPITLSDDFITAVKESGLSNFFWAEVIAKETLDLMVI